MIQRNFKITEQTKLNHTQLQIHVYINSEFSI